MIERELRETLNYHKKILDLIFKAEHEDDFRNFPKFCSDTYGWNIRDLEAILLKLYNDKLIKQWAFPIIPDLTELGYEVHHLLSNPILVEELGKSGVCVNVKNLLKLQEHLIARIVNK